MTARPAPRAALYAEHASRGLCVAEIASVCRVSQNAVSAGLKRIGVKATAKRGLKTSERFKDPAERQAQRARLVKYYSDPKNREAAAIRIRKMHAEGLMLPKHLRDMTDEQREDYNTFRASGFKKAEALRAVGCAE